MFIPIYTGAEPCSLIRCICSRLISIISKIVFEVLLRCF